MEETLVASSYWKKVKVKADDDEDDVEEIELWKNRKAFYYTDEVGRMCLVPKGILRTANEALHLEQFRPQSNQEVK